MMPWRVRSTLTPQAGSRRSEPRITPEILLAKRKKRALEKQLRRTHLVVNKKMYVEQQHKLNHLIKDAKRQYFTSKLSSAFSSQKELFTTFSQLTGTQKVSSLPSNITQDELPDVFAAYFDNKISALLTDLDSIALIQQVEVHARTVFSPLQQLAYLGPVSTSSRVVSTQRLSQPTALVTTLRLLFTSPTVFLRSMDCDTPSPGLIHRIWHHWLCTFGVNTEEFFDIDKKALKWITSYINNRSFRLQLGYKISVSHNLKYGVSQGSVLYPLLYTAYTAPLAELVEGFEVNFHSYTDDTQLWIPVNFDKPDDLAQQIPKLENCVELISN